MLKLLKKLVEKDIIQQDESLALETEIRNSKKKEEELLLAKEIIPEKALFELKSEVYKTPLKDIDPEEASLKALELIPEESAKFYNMVPLRMDDDVLEVGMVYPEDRKAQESLKFLASQNKFSFNVFLITPSLFREILKQYRTLKKEMSHALESLESELEQDNSKKTDTLESLRTEMVAEDAPVIKMTAVILKYGVDGNASDIHIEPMKDRTRVRFRIDGALHSSIFLPSKIHAEVVARIKILSNLKIDETRAPQDGRFSTRIYDRDIDFRIATFPTSLGEKVAIRILIVAEGVKSFESLGLTGRDLKEVQEAVAKPYGLILSTGPTGSGKTTTLYTALNGLNKEDVNIVTLEDPIEYFIKGVNQSQIRPEIGYTFAQGLRQILRQDPDIIMVGEVRDEETASLTIHAALTGHIVLSTLHTNNAIGVIPRLIDMGIPPFLLPSALSLAIAQRLVGVLCPECKKRIKINKEMEDFINKELRNAPQDFRDRINFDPETATIYGPVGCKKCNWKGYKGRMALFEVLAMTPELAEITLNNPSEKDILAEAKRQDMVNMRQDGISRVIEGKTSIEEVLRVAEEK
jgi:type IV pilus assembly protein PilB